MKKVLVYGWYKQLNIGDELFITAFKHLFPDYEFSFCDFIESENLKDKDAVFIGGGSFLLEQPNFTEKALEILKNHKVFYIGVGVERDIHPTHVDLMSKAQLIATRSFFQHEPFGLSLTRLLEINPNVIWIPDLVYSLQEKVQQSRRLDRSVLVLPNVSVIPQNNDPHWKYAAWNYFKSEFSQFLDWLIEHDYSVSFASMCRNKKNDDHWIAGEIIASMQHRDQFIQQLPTNIEQLSALISQYQSVITQRFHGIVLSEMTKTPYVAIHHHDKLKKDLGHRGEFLSYYGISKRTLIDTFEKLQTNTLRNSLALTNFDALKEKVVSVI